MKKAVPVIAMIAGLPLAQGAYAATDAELEARLERLTKQNMQLMQRVEELEKRLAASGSQEVPEASAREGEGGVTGFLSELENRLTLEGLVELGGVYQDVGKKGGGKEDRSDLTLTTVQLSANAAVNDWVNTEMVLLYEDSTFGEETSLEVDEAAVTFGNEERFPLSLSLGKMYVPFGALLTHFPDDPLWDSPVTLVFGETNEKAALLKLAWQGLSLSAYGFNGDVDDADSDNQVDSYGFDANFNYHAELELSPENPLWGKGERFRFEDVCGGFDALIGASYLSNLADTDGLEDALGLEEMEDRVGGFAAYLHLGYRALFFDAEYMTATEEFEPDELARLNGKGAQPSVWNFETGFNVCTFPDRVLEVALQYAGSDETEGLGFPGIPENRYGINFNQELFEDVTFSLGYAHDEYNDGTYDEDDREVEDRDIVFSQVAVEF
ncbi:MAG: LbtU family siderophore porin [Deltaproteobacteria bacterium]